MRKRKPASWLAVTARAISARPSASIGVCERCSARMGAAVRRVVMAVAPRAVWPTAVWCSHSSDSAPLSCPPSESQPSQAVQRGGGWVSDLRPLDEESPRCLRQRHQELIVALAVVRDVAAATTTSLSANSIAVNKQHARGAQDHLAALRRLLLQRGCQHLQDVRNRLHPNPARRNTLRQDVVPPCDHRRHP